MTTPRAHAATVAPETSIRKKHIRSQDSALHRVPPEILSQIFRSTLPHARTQSAVTVTTAPWRLALVCRHWRNCALGDGYLWSLIHVDMTIPLGCSDTITHYYPLPALEVQLQRSANVPLDVMFEWRDSVNVGPYLLTLLEVVICQCHRWERLTFNKIVWDQAAPDMLRVLSGIRGRLPLLRNLTITSFGPDSSGVSDIFAVAPQLQKVLIIDAGRPSLSLPWHQLTHFRARFSAKEHLEIFLKAPNLVEYGIDVVDGELPSTITVALLPHLRQLFTWGTQLLKFLEAPTLEYLCVNGGCLDILPLFLLRSGCQLKQLILRHCVASPPTLVALLRHTPTLSSLEVHFEYEEDEHDPVHLARLFRDLKVSCTSTDLCPRLTSIRIIFDFRPTTDDWDSLCEMVRSRWDGGRRGNMIWLACVRIRVAQGVPTSVLHTIKALRDHGLDVRVLDFEGNEQTVADGLLL
ncbi:hypothetical protein B0H13DRAFT_1941122 [Mycena leptocephala]|nr:hypothetical protein B0H13DRAFT_1941122 [Mycena leptocephala]